MRTELLKTILAIPTFTGEENQVIDFLKRHCESRGYEVEVDRTGNVFVTKGRPEQCKFYPLVCAHTDSVHDAKVPLKILQDDRGCLYAVDAQLGNKRGCGGDDKAGVFICLELLESQPVLKAAFFWGEESFCKGSQAAGPEFFEDVGYCIEFDSPQSDIISFSSNGVQLFDEHGQFARIAVPILDAHGMDKWQNHPYTDIAILKHRYDFSCLNLPAGYYRMHSNRELVNLVDVANAIKVGNKLIPCLGYEKYAYIGQPLTYETETTRPVTGLVLEHDYGNE